MGKIKRFEVLFDNSVGAFYAGTQASGKVLLDLSDSIKIYAVKFKIFGAASVFAGRGDAPTSNPSNTEKYIDQTDLLFGSGEISITTRSEVLASGAHEFQFSFNIPLNVPSSFESDFGNVRYWCRASLHRPWSPDQTVKKAFSVVGVLDLNHEPLAFTPGFRQENRSFGIMNRWFGCYMGKGVSVVLKIPRCAFVPGERIHITAEVLNDTNKKVKKVEAFLQQTISYKSKRSVKVCCGVSKIGLLTKGAVSPMESQIWNADVIAVPPLPPTNLAGCRLITLNYLLTFIVFLEEATAIKLTIPVVIGTVPLDQPSSSQAGNGAGAFPEPSAPLQTTPPPAQHAIQPTAPPLSALRLKPPPSYQECVGMAFGNIRDAEDNQEVYGDMSYRPVYPIYPSVSAAQEVQKPQTGLNFGSLNHK